MNRMPKTTIDADDLLELIEAHDSWVGSMRPDEHADYLRRFAKLKARAERLLEKYNAEEIK